MSLRALEIHSPQGNCVQPEHIPIAITQSEGLFLLAQVWAGGFTHHR